MFEDGAGFHFPGLLKICYLLSLCVRRRNCQQMKGMQFRGVFFTATEFLPTDPLILMQESFWWRRCSIRYIIYSLASSTSLDSGPLPGPLRRQLDVKPV